MKNDLYINDISLTCKPRTNVIRVPQADIGMTYEWYKNDI